MLCLPYAIAVLRPVDSWPLRQGRSARGVMQLAGRKLQRRGFAVAACACHVWQYCVAECASVSVNGVMHRRLCDRGCTNRAFLDLMLMSTLFSLLVVKNALYKLVSW